MHSDISSKRAQIIRKMWRNFETNFKKKYTTFKQKIVKFQTITNKFQAKALNFKQK